MPLLRIMPISGRGVAPYRACRAVCDPDLPFWSERATSRLTRPNGRRGIESPEHRVTGGVPRIRAPRRHVRSTTLSMNRCGVGGVGWAVPRQQCCECDLAYRTVVR